MTETSGTAKLRPRARLIGLIGEDLISDEAVAVVELVKNAYDADARRVTVQFLPASEDQLIVEDDGHGMSLRTVLSTWFEPGTPAKSRNDRSPAGRVYQGAKGIGRFASARLARSLFLESRMGPTEDGVAVLFDWGAFDEESFLDEIEVAWETRDLDLSRGTRLTLEGLRKHWHDADFRELHSRLSRMISPFHEVSDFSVVLQIPDQPELSGEVQPPQLLAHPRYELAGTLDEDGYFDGYLRYESGAKTLITHHKLGGEDSRPECGPFETEIRVWDRDREGLDPLVDKLNATVTEVRRTLNGRFHAVAASPWSNNSMFSFSEGFKKPSVSRGRLLSKNATLSRSA